MIGKFAVFSKGCEAIFLVVIQGLLFFLLSISSVHPEEFESHSDDFWTILFSIGGSPGPYQISKAFSLADSFKEVFDKMIFYQKYDKDLENALLEIGTKSGGFSLKDLYRDKNLPWREDGKKKFFSYNGQVERDIYHLFLTKERIEIRSLGDTENIISLRPVKKSSRGFKNVFVLQFNQQFHTGFVGLKERLDMANKFFVLIDNEEPYLNRIFKKSFPNTSQVLSKYFQILDVVERNQNLPSSSFMTKVNLIFLINEEALKVKFPNLYKIYKRFFSRAYFVFKVKDAEGHNWVQVIGEKGKFTHIFLTRKGLIYRGDHNWQPVDSQGFTVYQLYQKPFIATMEGWIKILGMKLGFKNFIFDCNYQDGTYTFSLKEIPEMVLPLILKQLFYLILGEFMEVIRYGDNGKGITYKISFRTFNQGGYYQDMEGSVPLKDSAFLSFMGKLGRTVSRSSLQEKVIKEYKMFMKEITQALGKDYRWAKVRYGIPL